jgi:hypothetical protein
MMEGQMIYGVGDPWRPEAPGVESTNISSFCVLHGSVCISLVEWQQNHCMQSCRLKFHNFKWE